MKTKYLVLPGTDPDPEYLDEYTKAFQLWKDVWSATFLELDGTARLFSDDFSRQDEVGAIFDETDQCLALVFLRESNLSLPGGTLDSYFAPWPPEALEKLTRDGSKIQVGSYITVAPAHRGPRAEGPKLKGLLLELAVQHLLASDCAAMTGITRRDKGVHHMAYGSGATLLQENIIYHGVPTDLVAWYAATLKKSCTMSLEAARLWSTQTTVRRIQMKINLTQAA